jgi:hypothetical protein
MQEKKEKKVGTKELGKSAAAFTAQSTTKQLSKTKKKCRLFDSQ